MNAISECRLHLDPDRIGFVENPRVAGLACAEPLRSHHDNQDITLAQNTVDTFPEIGSVWDAVDVHEDRLSAIVRNQAIVYPSGDRNRIGTTV
jgi:hypothetical protein